VRPIWVYDNWGAYTDGEGGFDDTRLTEDFAITQLRNAARLTEHGVRFDYHMMNAFWFEPRGGYREWRRGDWPNGPERWLAECREHGILPGLWFGTNVMWKTEIIPEWADSEAVEGSQPWMRWGGVSLSHGSFLGHLIETMQQYHDLGVRMFEFDVADFGARTTADIADSTPDEARERNVAAFTDALRAFRRTNPEARFAAFNGFGGDFATPHDTTSGPDRFVEPVDARFAEIFDSLYTGDTRVSDVPERSFWRSVDLYNDHKARKYEANGIPLEQTDGFFVMATTWFGYHRRAETWRSSLIHMAARGARKKTIYGDVGLLDDEDARWFARVQAIYDDVLDRGRTRSFGPMPGSAQGPYGFASFDDAGALQFAVNPTQEVRKVALPHGGGRVLFTDQGFVPTVVDGALTLGPEQIALVGSGRFDDDAYDLGLEPDVVTPTAIAPVPADFAVAAPAAIEAVIPAPEGAVRIVCQQFGADGLPRHTREYVPEEAERAGIDEAERGRVIRIEPSVDGVAVPFERSATWAQFVGTSWGVIEIPAGAVIPGTVLTIRCSTRETQPTTLRAMVYAVAY
jgi:hypothetical protein